MRPAPIKKDLFIVGFHHLGFAIALAAAFAVWLFMEKTVWGFEIRAVGFNPKAASIAGVSINAAVLGTALISGGVAGMSEVTGLKGYLTLDLSPGFGCAGVAVAKPAQLYPLGVIASSIFLSAIFVGADSMSRDILSAHRLNLGHRNRPAPIPNARKLGRFA